MVAVWLLPALTAAEYAARQVMHNAGQFVDPGEVFRSYGQLSDGSTVSSSVPQDLYASGALAGQSLAQITAGTGHTCALDSTGTAYCWGDNHAGDTGDNTTT